MDWQIKMNHVLNHIENNITDKISIETLAESMCCFVWKFQRLFFVCHAYVLTMNAILCSSGRFEACSQQVKK